MGCVGTKTSSRSKSRPESAALRARSFVSIVSERQAITIVDGDRVSHRTVVSHYQSHTYGRTATANNGTVRLLFDDELQSLGASLSRRSHKADLTEHKSRDARTRPADLDLGDQLSGMQQSVCREFDLAGLVYQAGEFSNKVSLAPSVVQQVEDKPSRPADVASLLSSIRDRRKDHPFWKKINEAIQKQQLDKNFSRTRTIHQDSKTKIAEQVAIEEKIPDDEIPSPYKKSTTSKFKRNSKVDIQLQYPPNINSGGQIISSSPRRRRSSILLGMELALKLQES